MTILDVATISKSFGGVRAVAGVTFRVSAGEMLALIGPTGAGQPPCFTMLIGQTPPDSGRIALQGRDITGLSPRRIWRMGVGRTFQITATFASMTVRENVQVALLAHHRQVWRFLRPAAAWFAPEADALLSRVGMQDQASRAAGVLAYGDLKRLELAIALANAPTLLLMDEPTAGMAPAERIALMQLTRTLASQQKIAVLFTEHDMDVVFGVADRILVLNRGELIAEGDGPTIRADTRVREVYLGSGTTSGGH